MPLPLLAAGIGALGNIAGAGLNALNKPPAAPGPRRLAESTVRGNDYFGGRQYAIDTEQAQQYAALNQMLQSYGLFGSPGGSQNVSFRTTRNPNGTWNYASRTIQTPQSEGLLSMIGRVQPELSRLRTSGDPQGNDLLDLLTQDATGLVRGGSNPYDDHELMQSIRAAQAARGMGYGTSDVLAETLGLDRGREQRRIGRGAYGAQIAGLRQSLRGDPLTDAVRLLGVGQQSQGGVQVPGNIWNPTAGAAQNAQYAGQMSAWNASQNNTAGLFSGLGQLGQAAVNNYATTPNPYFGRDPGDVPYQYRGDPSSPYRYR